MVLDVFFAIGPVFNEAAKEIDGERNWIHILTRSKKNVVAYFPYGGPQKPFGRRRVYGAKIKIMKLFDSGSWEKQFQTMKTTVYQKQETIRI